LITSTGMASSGAVTASSFDSSSDVRFKKDIGAIDDPLEIINKLNGVKYKWKSDEFPGRNFDNSTQLGFIAQEVEKVLPDIVGTDGDGWKSIKYTQVIAVLVEGMKKMVEIHEKEMKKMADLHEKEMEGMKKMVEIHEKEMEGMKKIIGKHAVIMQELIKKGRHDECDSLAQS